MSISADERRARILEAVRSLGSVKVTDLAARLGVPAVTVRRDVAALADGGVVRRSHGSVSMPDQGTGSGGRTLGLVVPTVSKYFDEVIAGARAAAAAAGAHLVLGIASYDSGDDSEQALQLVKSGVQGLMLTPNWMPDSPPGDQAWIGRLPVPAVLVERRTTAGAPAAGLDSVGSDHHYGVLLALRHLSALGHRSVVLAARADTYTAQRVRSGYAEGCAALAMAPHEVIDIRPSMPDSEALAQTLADAAAGGVRAALVHNDQDAIQLPPLLRARGLKVPDDIALISYDDVFAALGAPPLTAVAPPKRAVGAEAVELLLRRLAQGPAFPVHHTELLPGLTIRSSCGGSPG